MGRRAAVVSLVILTIASLSCARRHARSEIGREHAIQIACGQFSFQPSSIEAVKATSNGRPVWRVTIRARLPGQPPGLFETRIVDVDRQTAAILSIAQS
jgi:hypothetical protein